MIRLNQETSWIEEGNWEGGGGKNERSKKKKKGAVSGSSTR